MAKPGVMFYFELRPCIKRLTLEEKGRLFEAILDYSELGSEPEMEGVLGVAWDFIRQRVDSDSGRYNEKVARTRYAAAVREAKKKKVTLPDFDTWQKLSDAEREQLTSDDIKRHPTTTSTTTTASTSTTTTTQGNGGKPRAPRGFAPPTLEEVRSCCLENRYPIDPQRFLDYYTSVGWKVGRNPMKDWKAALRSWAAKERPTGRGMPDYGGDEKWSL